jgi:hypothetical protein
MELNWGWAFLACVGVAAAAYLVIGAVLTRGQLPVRPNPTPPPL